MSGDSKYNDAYFDLAFGTVNEKLDEIKEFMLSKASAASVKRLEDRLSYIEQTHIPCATVASVKKELEEMRKEQTKFKEEEFDPIKKATEGAVYFGKHPWQLRAVIVGGIMLLAVSAVAIIPSWYIMSKWTREAKAIKVEMIRIEEQSKQNPNKP